MKRTVSILPLLMLLSCLPNPDAPTLDPPGTQLLFDANFSSIQINGDFMPGDNGGWDAADARHEMQLAADHLWRLGVSVTAEDLADELPPGVELKFTHDGLWSPDNFGAGDEVGQAELSSDNPDNIFVEIGTGQGFYIFEFNDDTYRYSASPEACTGLIGGDLSFEGEEAEASLTLSAQHAAGDVELWTTSAGAGAFELGGLADSLYTLQVSAAGYASTTVADIRVSDGESDALHLVLDQVFGAASGRVSFSDEPDSLPVALVLALKAGSEIARDSTDAAGDYLISGLSPDTYDLAFSAAGYEDGQLPDITISGDEESAGNDITLTAIEAALPDEPWFSPDIDGVIDEGWLATAHDGGHVSGWGSSNDFDSLYVAWDADRIYVAVSGGFEDGNNTVNFYADKDYGLGTGVVDFSTLSGDAEVGDHLRKNIDISAVAGFGADAAASVWGLYYDPAVSDLSVPSAIVDLDGFELASSTSAIEFSLPWLSLYPDLGGGIPPSTEIAFFCVIGGGGDEHIADDTLPPVDNVNTPDNVVSIVVDGDGR